MKTAILSNLGDYTTVKITDAKLHFLILTLSTKDHVNLTKQLMVLKNLFIRIVSEYSCKSNRKRKEHI